MAESPEESYEPGKDMHRISQRTAIISAIQTRLDSLLVLKQYPCLQLQRQMLYWSGEATSASIFQRSGYD